MKKFFNKRVKCTLVAGVLVVSMLASYGVVASRKASADGNSKTKVDSAIERLQAKRNETLSGTINKDNERDNEVVRAIITLKGKSVADSNDVSNYSSKLKSKEEKVLEKQETVIEKVEKLTGNKVVNQSGYLVNSFSIDATRKQLKKIAKIEGVKEVNEAIKYKSTMATAVVEGNAKAQWESSDYGYTGEGVVVAVIDTGVNYKHKDMVLDEGVKNKYSKKEWEKKIKLLGYGEYFTEKVPFGYDYTKGTEEALSGGNEHGYHVSGIVAANGEVVGVAKNAQIVGLKVLNDQGFGCSDDIVKGIEDAVKLGVDVINMSLGYDRAVVSDDDFEQAAIQKASEEGIICCIAAGNSGSSTTNSVDNTNKLNMKDTTTVGTPVAATSSLGVASADNVKSRTESTGTFKVNDENITVEYTDPFGYGFNIENVNLVNVEKGVDAAGKITFKEKEVNDSVAIVTMGISTLNEKLYKIAKAGAKGIIVINKDNVINNATDIPDWYGVPIIIVNETDGAKFIQAIAKGNISDKTTFSTVSITDSKETSSAIRMSYFSSWGPTNELGIKPEITAPGGNIKSTLGGTDEYAVYSGTSMATPFIAGSEAVMINALRARGLKLEGKELSKFLKNSMMNTADVIIDPETNNPYSVRCQGAGMVDVYGAVDNNVLATYNGEAKVELGEIKGSKKINITLTNYGKKSVKYNLKDAQIYTDNTVNNNIGKDNEETVHNIIPVDGAKITFNKKEVTVKAKSKVAVTATVTIPSTYNKNSYVEAFILFEGNDTQNIGMPVLGFYGDWNAEPIIDTPVYEKNKGTSVIEKANIGVESATSLVESDSNTEKIIYGKDLIKKADIDSENRGNSSYKAQERTAIIANENGFNKKEKIDVSNAVKAKIGDRKEVAIVNSGDSVVFKISTLKRKGFKIEFDNNEIFNIAIYDKKLNYLGNNLDYWSEVYLESPEYSMSLNSTYYVVIRTISGSVTLTNVNFVETKYSENSDLIKMSKESKKNDMLTKLKLNKVNTLKEGCKSNGILKVKTDGYYTFNLDKLGFFNMALYEYKFENDGSLISGKELMYEDGYKSMTKELKLYKDRVYILSIKDLNEYGSKGVVAKVKIDKTDGSNSYTLEKVYDGEKVAFSPNGDGIRDEVVVSVSQLRNAKDINIKVLNKNKEVVKTLFNGIDQVKQYYEEWSLGYGKLFNTGLDTVGWDGLVYNQKTGDYDVAKDGQYYIQIESKLTKKSLPQIVTMPLKIDTVEPQLDKFEVSKDNTDTIITFNIKDNVALSPYCYIDIAEKVMYYGEEETNNISVAKAYVETEINESGDYVVNLGNIGESKITMLLEDQAGNQITKAVNYDPSLEEDVDIDMEDDDYDDYEDYDDEEDVIQEICDGTSLLTKLEDGMFIDPIDDEIFIKGECIKGTEVEVEGYETIYDEIEVDYGDVPIYEGSEYFYIHIPVSKDVISYSLPLSVKRDGKEIFNQTYRVSIDIDDPTITLLENSLIAKLKKINNGTDEILLLKKMNSNKFTYKIQITDSNFDEESFDIDEYVNGYDDDEIDAENFISEYEYEGNGVYNITTTLLHGENVVGITAKDLSGKEVGKKLHIFMAEDVNLYNEVLDNYTFDVSIGDLAFNDVVLDKSRLNKNGTYTIEGTVGTVPDKLEINGKRVEVNPATRKFKHNITIKKGITKINIALTVDGKTKNTSYAYYYDEIKVKYNNLPKANSEGVITTNKQMFDLSGVISSYVSVAEIEINGDSVYSTWECISSVDEKVFSKDFDYKIKLAKGKNYIQMKVVTGYGHEAYKYLIIEYK